MIDWGTYEKKCDSGRYHVTVVCERGVIKVSAQREHSFIDIGRTYHIYPLTWTERVLGTTIEAKVCKAKSKMQRMCCKANGRLDYEQDMCKQLEKVL